MSGKDDRELEIAKEDTAQIWVQFVRLHSHSAAVATVDPQSPGSPVQATAPPASSAQEQHRSQLAEGCAPGSREPPVIPTLTRSKSRDASRKETHPKAVHSVVPPSRAMLPSRASVKLVSNQHCRAKEASSAAENGANTVDFDSNFGAANTLSLSPPSASSSPKTDKQRPDKLTLKHKRMPSSHSAAGSDSSGKTTPAQDPPMDPLPLSPIDFALSSFPPMSTTADHLREGLTRSAVHTLPRASKSVADSTSQIPCTVSHERVRECCQATTTAVEGDPRAVKARMIADRLKHIGDDLEEEYIKEKLDDITNAIGDAVISNNPLQFISYVYTQSDLSWRKVAELFKLFYRFMESVKYDDQFTLFEKVWYCLLDGVVPWIQANGGWSYYLRATGPGHPTNTPSVVRRNQPLVPAQSVPVLLDPASLPSCVANRVSLAATPNRAHVVEGRQAYTPQMPRHTTNPMEQSSPCLIRSYTQPQSENFVGRDRLWSLSESGNFKKEDGSGVEDIEKSISELDVTEDYMVFKEDDEESEGAFGTSQEEEEEVMEMRGDGEEGRKLQEADRTLTSASLHSGLSLHSSSSSINNSSTSPPIVVPSPHFSSQPETVSTEDFHCDSGIENLSLSCSPLSSRVSFSVGGVNPRHSPMVHARQQTSLTSLSSAASASPIHSPSSCKNSSSNGPGGYFSVKTRPRSSGSLKESHPKQSGDSPSQCRRAGSLTRRPRPQTTTHTPNRVSTDSGHSNAFESPIPVRRMSTSAAVIYGLVKDFFGSP